MASRWPYRPRIQPRQLISALQLLAEGFGGDALGLRGWREAGWRWCCWTAGDVGQFVIHFGVAGDQVELLCLSLADFSSWSLEASRRPAIALLRFWMSGRFCSAGLDTGCDDQQPHPLDDVVGRDDVVIDGHDNALGEFLRRLRRRRRGRLGRSIRWGWGRGWRRRGRRGGSGGLGDAGHRLDCGQEGDESAR